MSWLFDRLCEIAVADEVEVVLVVDLAVARDRSDWAEVLVRAASVPQMTVTSLPAGALPESRLGPSTHSIDLDESTADDGRAVLARLFDEAAALGRALQVRGGAATLRPAGPGVRSDLGRPGRPAVVAADTPGHGLVFGRVGERGLSIAVGGVDPLAHVHVASPAGAVSIIDALVTLRSFAFGSSAGRGERDVVVA